METLTDVVQLDLVPLVAATLKEAARLAAAVEGLAREVDQLTAEPRPASSGTRTGCSARSSASSAAPTSGGDAMNRQLLEHPFDPAQIKQRKGRNGVLDYVEGHTVIARLNAALDGAWSFEVVAHEVRDHEVLVLGKLTAAGIVKMQFGASQVTRDRETKALISLGDDLKAAATDALKKCATFLGVGLHLYAERPLRPEPARPAWAGLLPAALPGTRARRRTGTARAGPRPSPRRPRSNSRPPRWRRESPPAPAVPAARETAPRRAVTAAPPRRASSRPSGGSPAPRGSTPGRWRG